MKERKVWCPVVFARASLFLEEYSSMLAAATTKSKRRQQLSWPHSWEPWVAVVWLVG